MDSCLQELLPDLAPVRTKRGARDPALHVHTGCARSEWVRGLVAIHGLIFLDDWSFDCTTHLLLLMVQKALVSMDESGTGAVEATVDHPFVFLIRDIETGAILFVGRVVDPS